ncbi:MAG: MarP family serine protease [Acidimicrobiia bacterium]|nr:MarP family serine protease [Acidimicrobiia bacterium]
MSWFDGIVLVAVAIGALIGFRVGLMVRALSWFGLAVGLVFGLGLVSRVAASLAATSPGIRLLSVSALVVGLALLGHTAGLLASRVLRHRMGREPILSAVDHWAGGGLGAIGVLVLLWLLVPALRSTPGWPARAARDSALVALVNEYAPAAPHSARVLGRIVAEAPYPLLHRDDQDVGNPPASDAGPRVDAIGAASVVLVQGHACGLRISGTGFAVKPNLILTNAHVVAGESSTAITTVDGRTIPATVVTFDALHDVAVLRISGDGLPILRLGATRIGTIATVFGHPNGGSLRAAPARVARWIDTPRTDIYRGATIDTPIVGLAAHLIVGDSGGPVVGPNGLVQAMVFAVDPARDTTGFALSTHELLPIIARAREATGPAGTGGCLVG